MGNTAEGGLPFTKAEGPNLNPPHSVWQLYDATANKDNSKVSIFSANNANQAAEQPLVENSLKMIRKLHHPSILGWIDNRSSYLVTESVVPLRSVLGQLRQQPMLLSYGLLQIVTAVGFLNNDGLVHGRLCVDAVYVARSGDWKLFGLEHVGRHDDTAALFKQMSIGPAVTGWVPPPEALQNRWNVGPASAVDAWGLACLMCGVFRGDATRDSDLLAAVASIPPALQADYSSCMSGNVLQRPNPTALLKNAYFDTPMAQTMLFLENLALKDSQEKEAFFRRFPSMIESLNLSSDVKKHKLLPLLLAGVQISEGNSKIFPVLFQLTATLTPSDFVAMVQPVVLTLFASTDRAVRIALLSNVHLFIGSIDPDTVVNTLYPALTAGFLDSSPILRELTIKSMVHVVPKLTAAIVDGDLLRYLSKLQVDAEGTIRTINNHNHNPQ
eukprot:gnl/Spiro4/15812_TR8508_c0_g3_i1.p1 gnl/Spiro4/15812_TR8508_c0_g3~~gnl/Spiro4/15812_TR8508_c0_g3_i1.p1  ORF type:complete len:469 (-),score=155.36 gnl/Spiro4/15812_TR8508_c0_g3_i1:68-1390(-)